MASFRWRNVGINARVAALFACAMPVFGGDLQYDLKAIRQKEMIDQVTMQTRSCMRDGSILLLREGIRDSQQIVAFIVRACGGILIKWLTQGAEQNPPEEAMAVVEGLAYDELRYIPGLSRSAPEPTPAKPVPLPPLAAQQSEIKADELGPTTDQLVVYPSVLGRAKRLELGELILLLMPDKGQTTIGWDHRANSAVRWISNGYDERKAPNGDDLTIREGLARVHVLNHASTVVRSRKMELGWTVAYSTSAPAKFGPMIAEISPGIPNEPCFGPLYEGCSFDPLKSLQTAGIAVRKVCEKKASVAGGRIIGYQLTHPKRRPTDLRWIEIWGSGGTSSSLEMRLQPTADDLCEFDY